MHLWCAAELVEPFHHPREKQNRASVRVFRCVAAASFAAPAVAVLARVQRSFLN